MMHRGLRDSLSIINASLAAISIGACIGLAPGKTHGQDIFVAPFARGGDAVVVGRAINITDRVGYDNQPCFGPGASYVIYASYTDTQSDIFRYDIMTERTTRLTRTAESEYSPTVIRAGTAFSAVRVEADSTQRLWQFDIDGSNPRLVLRETVSVGYHAWIDDETVALFIVGEPHELVVANATTGTSYPVARRIGRALHRIPGTTTLSFTREVGDGGWRFFRYAPGDDGPSGSVPLLAESQDCTWSRDGEIIMARADSLFIMHPLTGRGWRPFAALSDQGIRSITRLALSEGNEYIAMVAADAEQQGAVER